MSEPDESGGKDQAVAAFVDWAAERLGSPSDSGLLANTMEDLIAGDATITRVDQVAARLGLSIRGVQRLAQRFIGLAPLAVIRRYRLQEAAQRLRADPSLPISTIAAELGYSDHAHLTSDFRHVLGLSPSVYRTGR